MNETRINHTGHNHPATPAGRAACRRSVTTPSSVLDDMSDDRDVTSNVRMSGSSVVHAGGWNDVGNAIVVCTGGAPKNMGYALVDDAPTCKNCIRILTHVPMAAPGRDYIGRNCK